MTKVEKSSLFKKYKYKTFNDIASSSNNGKGNEEGDLEKERIFDIIIEILLDKVSGRSLEINKKSLQLND